MKSIYSLLYCLIIFSSKLSIANVKKSDYESSKNNISFIENMGQVHDQNQKSRPDVLFSGKTNDFVFHLKSNGISYQFNKVDSWREEIDERSKEKRKNMLNGTIYRLDVTWLNANSNYKISKGTENEGFNNYYSESCPYGAVNVKSYNEVVYQNIYNGINLKWYQKNGKIKYDYIVEAGADYKNIQLKIDGASKIQLSESGELVIVTPLGNIIEQAPIVIQDDKTLKSKWVIKNYIASFEIENLNPNQNFVIDPGVRAWGTYYGGSSDDEGRFCSTDPLGNVYLMGITLSNNGTTIATSGSHQSVYSGAPWDSYLVKFNSNGIRLWATYYGGAGNDIGTSCNTDANGNVFLSGHTTSSNPGEISTMSAHQTSFAGGSYDAFLVKFDLNGIRLWGTYYGASSDDRSSNCVTDASGNVYLSGYTRSNASSIISSSTAHQVNFAGGYSDAYLVKFNGNGVRQWATYYGGSGDDYGYYSNTDAAGNVYLVGMTTTSTGAAIATAGVHQISFGGVSDAFLVKFNSNGVRQFGTYYGGNGNEQALSCAIDISGNIYLCGSTTSTNTSAISTSSAHQVNNGGNDDSFLAKFDVNCARQWGTYYGGAGSDIATSSAISNSGDIYISGNVSVSSGSVMASAGAHQTVHGGGIYNAYLARFDANGNRQWSTFYGGSNNDRGWGCATDGIGNVYLCGEAKSTDISAISTSGSHQENFAGVNDAYIVKFNDCIAPNNPTGNNVSVCENANAVLNAASSSSTIYWYSSPSSSSPIASGNTYSVSALSAGTYTFYAEAYTCVPSTGRTPITLTVNSNPVVSVVVTPNVSICEGESVVISASGAVTYTWLDDNSTNNSRTETPAVTTTYTLVGKNSSACSDTTSITITVNPLPSVAINSSSTSICVGAILTLSATGANTYTWSNSSVGNSISASPITSTLYSVLGEDVNGCQNSAAVTITVNPLPNVTITAANDSICDLGSISLVANGASSYSWLNDGTIGSINLVSPGTTTIYTVMASSSQGCSASAFFTLTVNSLPNVTASAFPSNTVCLNQQLTLQGGGALSFVWSNNEGDSDPFYSPPGVFTHTVTGTDLYGCSNTAQITVTVLDIPSLEINSSNGSPICAGQSTTLTASGAVSYEWADLAITNPMLANNPIRNVSPSSTTTYSLSGTDNNGCTSHMTFNVFVTPLPIANIISSDSLLCIGESATLTVTSGYNYLWLFNGAATNTVVVSPTSSTTYSVYVSDQGCDTTIVFNQIVDLCTGIDNHKSLYGISFFPNPFTNVINISNPYYEKLSIVMVNNLGQEVLSFSARESEELNATHLSSGIYYMKITIENQESKLYKIIKN